MRPYGVTKFTLNDQDKAGNMFAGRKPSIGKLPGKNGEFHPLRRNADARRAARRFWKRKARQEGKRQAQEAE